jgi:RNA 2',3'-cyclic 3'-phosphodiesterase
MARDRASRPEAKPLRLFAAVDAPKRAVDALADAVAPWRERLPGGRWVRPENWHVTVKFLGRTWPRLVQWVHESCREAAASVRPFRLSLDGLGVFPGPSRARVLWAGLRDEEGSLGTLAEALDRSLAKEFPPEKRRYTGHLTVARFDPPVPVREAIDELRATEIDTPPFRVTKLVLYRSHLSPRGARYEALEAFPLGG